MKVVNDFSLFGRVAEESIAPNYEILTSVHSGMWILVDVRSKITNRYYHLYLHKADRQVYIVETNKHHKVIPNWADTFDEDMMPIIAAMKHFSLACGQY